MRRVAANIHDLNQSFGHLLREARERKHVSIVQCADLLGTSRRRYAAMEAGEAMIGLAEMKLLENTLNLTLTLGMNNNHASESEQPLVVQAKAGASTITIRVTVE